MSWGEPLAQPHSPHGLCFQGVAKAALTLWDIPGPFISSLWLQAALSTARGEWPRDAEVGYPQGCCQIHTCKSEENIHPIIWNWIR